MDNHPTKERVREWLQQRWLRHEPPPEMEQIQRQLGWTQPLHEDDDSHEDCAETVAA